MPGVTLSQLRDRSRTVHIHIGPDTVKCEVYPGRLTNEVMDRYREAQEEPRDYDEMAAAFAEVVVSWDILDDDEKPLPIDGDTFRQISVVILNHIWAELTEAVTPKSRKKSGS